MSTPMITQLHRRTLLASVLLFALPYSYAANQSGSIEVWKDPNCGCCKDWVTHLEQSGFKVKVNQTGIDAARERLGLPSQFGSCHTAVVDGYVIEGHVPANDIKRLLKEKPVALGLAVPGMPVGSPGMDGSIYNGRKDPYDVLLVSKSGNSRIFQSYR